MSERALDVSEHSNYHCARLVTGNRRRRHLAVACAMCIALCVVCTVLGRAQSQPSDKIIEQTEKEGCAVLETKIQVCKYDYSVNGKVLEAISFRPTGSGPFPGVLLIPGYHRTAKNYVPLGIRLAQDGFASVAVTQPGFGTSAGPRDFVGPKTIAALTEGYRKLRRENYVDRLAWASLATRGARWRRRCSRWTWTMSKRRFLAPASTISRELTTTAPYRACDGT